MSTTLNVLTYNTHLFGDDVRFFHPSVAYHDDTRFDVLGQCLKDPTICSADIIAIQEMWSSSYIEHITTHTVSKLYPNFWYHLASDGHVHASNAPGLLLMARENVTFDTKNAVYYDYIHEIGPQFFEPTQDSITGKGYLKVPASINGAPFTLITTHMPTSASKYRDGVLKCFAALAAAVPDDGSPVLLMGDFNIDETKLDDTVTDPATGKHVTFYSEWIGDSGYLGPKGPVSIDGGTARKSPVGLTDGYRAQNSSVSDSPGYSVVGTTNTCWKHFNQAKVAKKPPEYDLQRIDYIMFRGFSAVDGSIKVQGNNSAPPSAPDFTDKGNQWVFTDPADHETRDLSDHYATTATLTL